MNRQQNFGRELATDGKSSRVGELYVKRYARLLLRGIVIEDGYVHIDLMDELILPPTTARDGVISLG